MKIQIDKKEAYQMLRDIEKTIVAMWSAYKFHITHNKEYYFYLMLRKEGKLTPKWYWLIKEFLQNGNQEQADQLTNIHK
jgi:hypothetical protein